MFIKINTEDIEFERKIQAICTAPFYKHSRGCPNFNKKEGCPPGQPLINDVFDFNKDLFIIYTVFNVGEFAERMRRNHPEWSKHPRQWYNPRRWQETDRYNHRKEIKRFLEKYRDMVVNSNPEAHGVNVTQLMANIGIKLNWQWPPEHILKNKQYRKNVIYRVSLGGYAF